MAKKFKKIQLKETEGGNFGNYKEARGGGTPVGQPWKGRNGRIGWENREKSGEVGGADHREDQPRTGDGKFTYNSVNGKGLSPASDPTRGETVNPVLTGGKNGVYIEDFANRSQKAQQRTRSYKEGLKQQLQAKSGSLYDEYKGKAFQKKSMKATKEGKKYTLKISENDIWDIMKVFDVSKGEFQGESENWITKQGAPGKAGTEAKKFAKKTGQEQYVLNKDESIKQIGEKQLANLDRSLKKFAGPQLNHGIAAINQVRKQMKDAGYDVDQYTDEQIDQILTQQGL